MSNGRVINKANSSISALLHASIEDGNFPSAVYIVAEKGQCVFADALGDAVREPAQHPASFETIYDLASLTKPFVTGLLCARLIERGELTLDEPVANHLTEFDRPDKDKITVRQLLTHTSGLPAWRPLYLLTDGRPEATLRAIAEEPLELPAGARVIYSDLGFIALGFLLQKMSGRILADIAGSEIIERLGLKSTFFNPIQAMQTGIAACESGNAYERDMCERDFAGRTYAGWRSDIIWGEVHDGNAHFLGGAAGHAGLFSNAGETLLLANQFIAGLSDLLSATTCDLFRQNMTPELNEARSFAWQLAATPESTAGSALPPDAFGHNGFTGTSCWIDAENKRAFILLTNRTHAHKLPFTNINSVRREFHRIAAEALDTNSAVK